MRSELLLVTCICLTAAPAVASRRRSTARRLYPIDAGTHDPSFSRFRRRLRIAVRAHDTAFLLTVLDPRVRNSFGGDEGIPSFQGMWQPSSPDTQLWKTLDQILGSGGTFNDRRRAFCAPYVFAAFPASLDAFQYTCITGRKVPLMERADAASRVVQRLSYDIVHLVHPGHPAVQGGSRNWVQVRTGTEVVGYVDSSYVRSPLDYWVCFRKTARGWKIADFVQGD